MNLQEFVGHFADQFDDTPASDITAATKFRDLEEWSSMLGLALIAMVDSEYGAKISGEEIRASTTVEDLYNVVQAKVA